MKKFRLLTVALILTMVLVGCGGFSEGLEDGMNDAMNGKTEVEAESQTEEPEETEEVKETAQEETTVPEEPEALAEKTPEEQASGSVNVLLTAPVTEHDVKNGTKTEVIGTWAEIVVAKELALATTQEEYAEFCKTVVDGSGYNWVTISFGDGTGIQFQSSISYVATYGTIDSDGCIEEAIGMIMVQDDGTYSYTEN